MRRIPGKIFVTMLLALLPLWAGSVQVHVDKPEVVKGDTVTFSITARGSEVTFPTVHEIGGFPILGTASRSNIAIVNGNVEKSYTKSYTFAPMKSVTIPPLKVTVDGREVTTDPVTIKVTDAPAPGASSGGKGPTLRLTLDKEHARVGEALCMRLILRYPRQAHYAQVELPKPEFPNFWIKPVGEVQRRIEGESVVETREYLLFPQKAGEYTLGPVTARIARRVRVKPPISDPFFNDDFFNDFFARLQWSRLLSNTLRVTVDPLPGGVDLAGDFSIRVEAPRREVAAGKPLEFLITVEGEGNVEDIPKFDPAVSDAVVYADDPKVEEWVRNGVYGGRFSQRVTVVADHDYTFPSLHLRYYDPKRGEVVEKKTAPIPVKVTGGRPHAAAGTPSHPSAGRNAATGSAAPASASAAEPGERESERLPVGATLLLALLGAAAGAGALWGWQHLCNVRRGRTVPVSRRVLRARSDRELFDLLLPYAKSDPEIDAALRKLEANLYKGAHHALDKRALAAVVAELEASFSDEA